MMDTIIKYLCSLELDKTVSILASIATFITAFISYWTLREMKKQRNLAIKPQILFKNTTFGYLDTSNIEKQIPVKWTGKDEKLKTSILFDMINAGQEVAKNIAFEYRLDIKDFIRIISHYDKKQEINIVYYKKEYLKFSSSFGVIDKICFLKANIGTSDKLEFLLTRSIQEKPSGFAIPNEYLLLISCLLYLSFKQSFYLSSNGIPKLFLKTSYEDIAGNKTQIFHKLGFFHNNDGDFSFSLVKSIEKEFKKMKENSKNA